MAARISKYKRNEDVFKSSYLPSSAAADKRNENEIKSTGLPDNELENTYRPSSSSRDTPMVAKMRRTKLDKPRVFSRPIEIGYYDPGAAPHCIPYHLYLLLKEAVDLMKKGLSLDIVEKKISFFSDFFYSHLPFGWKYDRDKATSDVAVCEALFAKGGPKYNISGFVPLGDPVKNEFDYETQLSLDVVFEFMRLIHSRKTPTPGYFMQWDETLMSFYCKLCSCFGIDYQHLEAASEDDVLLMSMGTRTKAGYSELLLVIMGGNAKKRRKRASSANNRGVEKISSNKDNQHMRKLSSSDEAFALDEKQICEILHIVRTRRLPPQAMFTQWDKYQISFYCKMCSCFGIDYQHLEAARCDV